MKWMTARALRTDNRVVMNSPDHPVRQGTRHVLLSGLGVVLALLLALGVYSAGSLSNVSRAGTLTTREYFQQSERLENVHLLLSSAASAIRDYLLDPDSLALSRHREQARASWAQAMKAMQTYEGVAASQRHLLTGQLDSQVTDYWAIADRSLEMTGRQRTDTGVNLLISQLVPLRDRYLATINEIAASDRADLRSAAANTSRFVKGAERRLWAVIALIVLLSLLVAGATVRYLR